MKKGKWKLLLIFLKKQREKLLKSHSEQQEQTKFLENQACNWIRLSLTIEFTSMCVKIFKLELSNPAKFLQKSFSLFVSSSL